MKRILCLFLVCCFLFSGCSAVGQRIKEPVSFYYIRTNYSEDMASVIQSEEREASGHRDDLPYLMKLYMMGPTEDSLRSPLPRGAKILSIENTGKEVFVQLSDLTKAMSDADFSLVCACLALTCFDLTKADTTTIASGEWSITMGRDSLTLSDSSAVPTEEIT